MTEHQYTAQIVWHRGDAVFTDNRYSRGHVWRFDGGIEVPASSSPLVVRLPLSVEAAVDPEEAFIASIASCHMLTFLSLAARQGYRVDDYLDAATGVMHKNPAGKLAVTRVTLRPDAVFGAARLPTRDELDRLHHQAHEECFIANSVNTQIVCEPRYDRASE
jgi:organic hydroperoxide reductase OsmC/OhrA